MSLPPRYTVNKNGENILLEAVKAHDKSLFKEGIQAERHPYIPSKFGQCAAGLLDIYYPDEQLITHEDWIVAESETLGTNNSQSSGFLKRATSKHLAYTLPCLMGIHRAVATNRLNEVARIRGSVNEADAWGYTPLVYAVGCCHPSVASSLIQRGADPEMLQGIFALSLQEIVAPGVLSIPPDMLHGVHFRISSSIAKLFDFSKTVDADSPVTKAITIHQAAASGNIQYLEDFLELGVPIEIKSYNGSTPLMCAALYGQVEAYEYLRSRGANSHNKNFMGEDAEILAKYASKTSRKIVFAGQERVEEEQKQEIPTKTENTNDERVAEEQVSQSSPNLGETCSELFVRGAKSGDFQTMAHAYLYLQIDNSGSDQIPRDLVEDVRKISHLQNKELILAWLFVYASCRDKEVMRGSGYFSGISGLELVRLGNPALFLRYMKDGGGLSSRLDDGRSLLELAAQEEYYESFKWLMRHGASGLIRNNIKKPAFKHLIDTVCRERKAIVTTAPKLIGDELFFALTTNNIELLAEYVEYGFQYKEATTAHGLTLRNLAKKKDIKFLSQTLDALDQGMRGEDLEIYINQLRYEDLPDEDDDEEIGLEIITEIKTDISDDSEKEINIPILVDEGDDEENIEDDNSYQFIKDIEGETLTPKQRYESEDHVSYDDHPSSELTGLAIPSLDSDDEEDGSLTLRQNNKKENINEGLKEWHCANLDRIRLNKKYLQNKKNIREILSELPLPNIIAELFLKAQDCQTYQALERLVCDDRATLELFWAIKLYVTEKISNLE